MEQSKKFLFEYEIESHLCLVNGLAIGHFVHPTGEYEVWISNLKTDVGTDRPLLAMHLITECKNIDTSEEKGRRIIDEFLSLLTFVTSMTFKRHRLNRIVDWTPGISERQCLKYQKFPGAELPYSDLDAEIISSVEILEKIARTPALNRILKWFSSGVRASQPEDQFQYFWFVIELLSQLPKPTEKINDACPKCGSKLHCEKCGNYPMHRPYPKQAISALIQSIITDHPTEFFDKISKVRNRLMHGDDIEVIELEMNLDLADLVDTFGRVAWTGILKAMHSDLKKIEGSNLKTLQIDQYAHRTLGLRVNMLVYGPTTSPPDLSRFADPTVTYKMTPKADSSGSHKL